MVAATPVRGAVIPASEFRDLALAHSAVHRRIMRQVRPLMSRITAIEQNRERLASLGTMAAGLAHELNNPAAARRSAEQLGEALDVMDSTLRAFVDAGVEREGAAQIADLREHALRQASERSAVSGLDAADAEDEMRERLETLGIPDAWRLAEPLAIAGVDDDWLAQMQAAAGPATPASLRSLAAAIAAHSLVSELRESTDRVSSLVGAVKAYAYMDRGGVVQADIHEGLETTLTVPAHKLKNKQIEIKRDYDHALPAVTIYGSELNQVWTNLLDNAIDAVGQSGTITVRTKHDALHPRRDRRHRTRDPAGRPRPRVRSLLHHQGRRPRTGLGLDTARRIVEDRHGGSLTFDTGERRDDVSTCGSRSPNRTPSERRLPHDHLHPPRHDHGHRAAEASPAARSA